MICASLNLLFFIQILLSLFCQKNSTFEQLYFSGGLPGVFPICFQFREITILADTLESTLDNIQVAITLGGHADDLAICRTHVSNITTRTNPILGVWAGCKMANH